MLKMTFIFLSQIILIAQLKGFLLLTLPDKILTVNAAQKHQTAENQRQNQNPHVCRFLIDNYHLL